MIQPNGRSVVASQKHTVLEEFRSVETGLEVSKSPMPSLRSFSPVALLLVVSSVAVVVGACSSSTTTIGEPDASTSDAAPTATATGTSTSDPPEDASTTVDAAPVDPTLSAIQAAIFTPSCAISRCHSGTRPSGDLNLEAGKAHAQLVGVASVVNSGQTRVVAGDAKSSLLANCLKGSVGRVGRMPDNKAALPAANIATIEAWINAGAKND